VARDGKNLYFYARSVGPLSPRSGPSWMWLLLDVDGDSATGWEGYDYVAHRTIDPDGAAWLEKYDGGRGWERAVRIAERVSDRELHLAIPRSALGLAEGTGPLSIDFKWADNLRRLQAYKADAAYPYGLGRQLQPVSSGRSEGD